MANEAKRVVDSDHCCDYCGGRDGDSEMVTTGNGEWFCPSCAEFVDEIDDALLAQRREAEQLVSKQLMLNQSRLTPKSGDRLTRRQRELLSEIASIDEGIGYELSYLIEPNWWMDLCINDQWNGPFPQIIADLAFPMEPEDPMNICWDEWEQNRGRLSETPEEEWKRLELEAIHKEIRDSNCD